MEYEVLFSRALILTILIETIILFIFIKYLFKISKEKIPNSKLIFAGIFASSLTLPYLWFILPYVINDRIYFIIFGELAVFLAESLFYKFYLNISFKKSLILSFICNLVSFGLGLVVF